MDLRKGSGLKHDERICIRCRGRKQLYKTMSGWCFDNSGGVIQDCPMCLGKGVIKKIPAEELFETKDGKGEENAKKENRQRRKAKETRFEKEY
jgi:hypothetical protein